MKVQLGTIIFELLGGDGALTEWSEEYEYKFADQDRIGLKPATQVIAPALGTHNLTVKICERWCPDVNKALIKMRNVGASQEPVSFIVGDNQRVFPLVTIRKMKFENKQTDKSGKVVEAIITFELKEFAGKYKNGKVTFD